MAIRWDIHQKFNSMLTQERIDRHVREGYWPNKTILDYLDESVARYPDKVAMVDRKSRYTYKELAQLVDRCALGLLEMGIRPGDVVGFQLPNWNEWVIIHYALTRIGAISNPLIPIYRGPQIKFMLELGEAVALFIPSEFRGFNYVEMVERIWPELPNLKHVVVLGDLVGKRMIFWTDFINTPWEEKRPVSSLAELRPDPNDITELIFTSGTTGEPKGVLHTSNTLITPNLAKIERLRLTEQDVFFMASTLAHQTGFIYGARLFPMVGGKVVFQDIWNANEFIEQIEREKVTYTMGATPFLMDTVNASNLSQHDISSFRNFICAGAPIPRALVEEARKKLPGVNILGGWGQTEDGLVTLCKPGDPDEKIINTDGYPFPGMEIKVVDAEGKDLPVGTEGDLLCRGQFVFVGYCKRPEFNDFTADGWFRTGDRARIDADGYVRITGRSKDIIIRGGENIPVAEVENVLFTHPKIVEAAVVAMPDPRLQERACAYVVLKPGEMLTFEEMKDFLAKAELPKPYWPERLEIVDVLPRTPSGKIQKFKLREDIEGKLREEQKK